MPMTEFMVLRNAARIRTTSPFEELGPVAETVPAAPEVKIEVHNVEPEQASGIANDPQVVAVALPMPTALIKPLDIDAGMAAATDAWGIGAIKADTSTLTGDGVVVAVLDTGI